MMLSQEKLEISVLNEKPAFAKTTGARSMPELSSRRAFSARTFVCRMNFAGENQCPVTFYFLKSDKGDYSNFFKARRR